MQDALSEKLFFFIVFNFLTNNQVITKNSLFISPFVSTLQSLDVYWVSTKLLKHFTVSVRAGFEKKSHNFKTNNIYA